MNLINQWLYKQADRLTINQTYAVTAVLVAVCVVNIADTVLR